MTPGGGVTFTASTLVHQTNASSPGNVTTFTVSIPGAAPGNTLICVDVGGATVQAAINAVNFTKRAGSLFNLGIECQDYAVTGTEPVDVNGNTTVNITLNAADNADIVIFELRGAFTFIAGARDAGPNDTTFPATQFAVTGNITVPVTNPQAVIVSAWGYTSATATANRRWWGADPLGRPYWSNFNNGIGATKFWDLVNISDVASGIYTPASSAVGAAAGTHYQAGAWAYVNPSPAVNLPYANGIIAENSKPGIYVTQWWKGTVLTGTIAGFCDKVSYLPGDTVNFKVDSQNTPFNVEITRLGCYGDTVSSGGKRYATFAATTVVAQPAATTDSFGAQSCAAWTISAAWTIPANITPGVYEAVFRRTDTLAAQGTLFVVRSTKPAQKLSNKICLKTAELSWQAYNRWGATTDINAPLSGSDLYATGGGTITTRARAVSFDRPYGTDSVQASTVFWDNEYALIQFLEGNGYDIDYYSSIDIDIDPTIPQYYTLAICSNHDEYWTDNLRNAFENARDNTLGLGPTNLAFFSANVSLWRVRFDPTDTNRRKMICYKDSATIFGDAVPGVGLDPVIWTGTFRDSHG